MLKINRALRRLRAELVREQGGLCWWCGVVMQPPAFQTREAASLDHIVPRADGGSDRRDNLVAACKACNSSRPSRALEQHNAEQKRRADAARKQGPGR